MNTSLPALPKIEGAIDLLNMHHRGTPLQAISHLLPPDHLLRAPLPSRFRISLDSPAPDLLDQLNGEPNWPALKIKYPTFETDYPPTMLHPRKEEVAWADLLCTAFTKGDNALLAWVGDALFAAALFDCAYDSVVNCARAIKPKMATLLVSKLFMSHLGLLYGVQLHEYARPHQDRSKLPAMHRVCETFEAWIGACAIHFGFPETITWVRQLLEPWVNTCLLRRSTSRRTFSIMAQSRCGRRIQTLHDSLPVSLPAPELRRHDLIPATALDVHRLDMSALLRGRDNGWDFVDVSGIFVPKDYPPPFSTDAFRHDALAAALTDASYSVYFGVEVPSNEGFRALGERVCKLVVTARISKIPGHTVKELNSIRVKCLNHHVLGRLGLLLNVEQHLRILRAEDDHSHNISVDEAVDGFRALVGLSYLEQGGWSGLCEWLEPLFWPWIQGALDGTFEPPTGCKRRSQDGKATIAHVRTSRLCNPTRHGPTSLEQ
ncbi:hypothetical protein B0H16DRAFT_1490568 [Mycena metata]|uniref:RNase III domain-containing protein n=1 Tax=Mycena metata TaxID=1033252 RepID=A0AAD7P3L7_9AGAR|nr:hypothetical protein B0H16DRAFT_1490568 [Mycena metata]